MRNSTLMVMVSLVGMVMGCDPAAVPDSGDDADTGQQGDTGAAEDEMPPIEEGTAMAVGLEVDEDGAEASEVALNAVSGVFDDIEVQADLGQEGSPDDRAGVGCADRSRDEGTLVLDFAACDRRDGKATLAFGDQQVTVTYSDDFAIDGHDVDGSVSVGFADKVWSVSTPSALTVDDEHSVDLSLSMTVSDGQLRMWGSSTVASGDDEASLAYGSAVQPLSYERGCLCAVSGAWSADVFVTIEEVSFDLDLVIDPGDGEDDYPPLEVAIRPVVAEASIGVDHATCGAPEVSASADDLEVEVSSAELAAAVGEACDAGDLDETDCQLLQGLLASPWFPESLGIDLPVSVLAEEVEDVLQSSFDAMCGAVDG